MKLNNGLTLFLSSTIAVLTFGFSGYQFLNQGNGTVKLPKPTDMMRLQAQNIATEIAPTVVTDPFAGWDTKPADANNLTIEEINRIAGQTPNAIRNSNNGMNVPQQVMSGDIASLTGGPGASQIRPLPIPSNGSENIQNDYSGMNGSQPNNGYAISSPTSQQPVGSSRTNVVSMGTNPGSVVSPQSLASGQAAIQTNQTGLNSTADAGTAQDKPAIVLRALITTDKSYAYLEVDGKKAKRFVKGDKLKNGLTILAVNNQTMSLQFGKDVVRIRVGQGIKL